MNERDGDVRTRERPPRPPEHPAIRERRRQVARAIGRQRRNRLVLGAAAILCVLIGYWLYTGPLLSVHGVTMRGYDRPDRDALLAALTDAAESGSIVSPPRPAMHETAAQFPWVERIHIARRWPRGLAVDVVQATPVAVGYAGEGDPVLLAADGRVLEVVTGRTGLGWVRLPGPPPAPGVYIGEAEAATLEFMAALPAELSAQVRDLGPTGEGDVRGRLEQGVELRLGAPERLHAKATALRLVLGALSPQELAEATYIDLTVPEHPAVGGIGATETEEAVEQDAAAGVVEAGDGPGAYDDSEESAGEQESTGETWNEGTAPGTDTTAADGTEDSE